MKVIDALNWARILQVPAEEYKFRPLLDYIGHPVKRLHRAHESCEGIVAVVRFLAKRQAGAHVEAEQKSVIGRFMGKRVEVINEAQAFEAINRLAKELEETCGAGFYDKIRNDKRRKRNQGPGSNMMPTMPAPALTGDNDLKHSTQWYDERRQMLERLVKTRTNDPTALEGDGTGNHPWDYILLEASQSSSTQEQKKLCQAAVSMSATDPWPYDRLSNIHVKDKEYEAAREVCEQYFDMDEWKTPRWAEQSLKILKRLAKLDRKLRETDRSLTD